MQSIVLLLMPDVIRNLKENIQFIFVKSRLWYEPAHGFMDLVKVTIQSCGQSTLREDLGCKGTTPGTTVQVGRPRSTVRQLISAAGGKAGMPPSRRYDALAMLGTTWEAHDQHAKTDRLSLRTVHFDSQSSKDNHDIRSNRSLLLASLSRK